MDTTIINNLQNAEDKELISIYIQNYPKNNFAADYPEVCSEIEKIAKTRHLTLSLGLAISNGR